MSNENYYVELINAILHNTPRRFKDDKTELAYRHGYLIGLIATMAQDDSWVHQTLKKHYNNLTEK